MRKLDIPKTADQLATFIKTTVHKAGFSDVIVAVSGGVDSATSISLAVKALEVKHVHALLMPYKDLHTESLEHSYKLLKQLKIPSNQIYTKDITSMVDSFAHSLEIRNLDLEIERTRLGNIMARVRMIVLYDFAKKHRALVQGTENKSEHYLGYYTRFGDEASDLEPLRDLYKTEAFQLANYLNVPKEIITKAPSANLWPEQTDEGQFGFSYKEADQILYFHFEKGLDVAEIARETKISKNLIDAVLAWVRQMEFKHALPHIPT